MSVPTANVGLPGGEARDEKGDSMRRVLAMAVTVVLAGMAPAHATHLPGSINGTVTGEGVPVGGICVDAWSETTYEYSWDETAPDGTYQLEDLPPGDYIVAFYDCAYPARYLSEYYDDADTYEEATPVTVAAEPVHGIDADLSAGGAVSGTVKDEITSAPVAGICVTAWTMRRYGEYPDWIARTRTASDGSYTVGGLPSGTVRLLYSECDDERVPPIEEPMPRRVARLAASSPPVAEGPGYAAEWWQDKASFETADPIDVVEGETVSGIDALLRPGGSISGSVRNPDGDLIVACVSVLSAETGDWVTFTYQDGSSYSVRGLTPGTYKVGFFDCEEGLYDGEWWDDQESFDQADEIVVAEGAEIGGIDAVLSLRPRPDAAVTDIDVRSIPLRTDDVTIGHTGWSREVDVDVANVGEEAAESVIVRLTATSNTDGSSRVLGQTEVPALQPDDERTVTFPWNGIGSIGDVTLRAEVCAYDDRNSINDIREERHYVVLGGSGFGFTAPQDSHWFGCYWETLAAP